MSGGMVSRLRRSYRANVFLLAAAQCVYVISSSGHAMFSGLAGAMLAPSPYLATVPLSLMVIGTVSGSIPMSFLMKRRGRRFGFLLGAAFAMAAGALAAYAMYQRSFALFSVACMLQGVYQSATLYYRYAAIELAPESYQGRAVAYVIGGGLVAALITPNLMAYAGNLTAPVTFAGIYLAMTVAGAAATAILGVIAFQDASETAAAEEQPRPLAAILRQPKVACAVLNTAASYALMLLLMTAAPLAIVGCGFTAGIAANTIRWHVVAMFLPSFFSGRLVERFGIYPVLVTGSLVFIASGLSAAAGLQIVNFKLSLAGAGLGWNLMLTGATALLAQGHRPSERAKVQAFNEFAAWTLSALASFAAGGLIETLGWAVIGVSASAIAALVLAVTLILLSRQRLTVTY